MQHAAIVALRVVLLAAPILLALAALMMTSNPEGDKPPLPDKGISGGTAPTGN